MQIIIYKRKAQTTGFFFFQELWTKYTKRKKKKNRTRIWIYDSILFFFFQSLCYNL